MPVSEKKKASNAKWNKNNMTILGCSVRKTFAEDFRQVCAAAGTSPNAVLKAAAEAFMEQHKNDLEVSADNG